MKEDTLQFRTIKEEEEKTPLDPNSPITLFSKSFVCPSSDTFPFFFSLSFFFFFSFCNSDSRSGSEVVLRLLVPGGSGDWSLCTGRRRSRSSGYNAGSQERPRQKDGATGGGTAAAPGTSSPHLAHHGAAEQSAAARKCNSEPGSGQST